METKYYSAANPCFSFETTWNKENHRFSGNNQHAIRGQCPI